MNSLAELVAAYQADTLKLPALFEALAARGPLSAGEYQAEVAQLERISAESGLDPIIIKALLAKLAQLGTLPEVPVEDADVTVVKPATQRPAAAATDDATVVQPAARPSSSVDGHTSGGTGTQRGTTGTGSGISSSSSTWEHLSEAEGGDFVAVGALLKGRFYLEKEIGRGGMGVVFLARDERKVEARDRDPYVAVKVLNDEFRRHPDSLIALQRESRRSQQLAHDNIVRVFDFDKDRTIVFMTMEYIDGSDLKQLIRERAYNGMPLAEARPLIAGMARALARAHAAGVVHSDFKPANVMVTREGVPKVFDFGIARAGKHMGEAVGEQTVFDAGTLGALTPAYASLEMIQGKEPIPADDVYALGCVAFELLTGKHPFDKVSVEVAMKEARAPPPVKGLTRHQYKVLCASVAFTSGQRLKSAEALVDGLREISLGERVRPYLMYGVPAALLLASGVWGWLTYQHNQALAHVVARFTMTRPDHYVDENQALQALDSLSENDRKRLIVDQSKLLQGFLLSRIEAYWDPAKDHYDYARAQQVFKLRDAWQLYSPALDLKRSAVEKEKNDLLNTLDTQLAQQIEANAIFADQPNNVVRTLDHIRAIDPTSPLLKNGELELKYDTAVGQSIDAGKVDEAAQQLKLAQSLFPDSVRLKQRAAQLAGLAVTHAPAGGVAAGAPLGTPADARKALLALSAAPTFTAEWQAAVAAAVAALHGDGSPDARRAVDALAVAVADHAAGMTDPQQLPQARVEVEFGLKYAPKSAPLLAQGARIDALQKASDASLAQASADAEVKSRIESMRSAAAADDVDKASQSLARIRTLQPDNPFLQTDGPRLLADAYLGLARDTFQKSRYQQAADVLANGLAALGANPRLQAAKSRYDLVIALMAAGRQPPSSTTYAQLRQQLDDARRIDAPGLGQLETDMKIRGQLTAGSLADQIDRLDPGKAAARSRDAVLVLVRKGEQAYARQNYSAAIANAKAALRLKPGDVRAAQLLGEAQHAQQKAMNSISIQ
jgi:non-specific serine/threonine protein kinase